MPKKTKQEIVKEEEPIKEEEEVEEEGESEEEIKEEIKPVPKPKRVISQRHQEHMVRMREKAILAKKQQAELTRKANELKNIQKQEKLMEKMKEAEKYDEYIRKQQEIERKQELMRELKEKEQLPPPQPQPKQPQRKIKKVIYEDEEDDEPDYSKLIAMENLNKLHQRALNERIFNSVNSYMNAIKPNYY